MLSYVSFINAQLRWSMKIIIIIIISGQILETVKNKPFCYRVSVAPADKTQSQQPQHV